jgi:hypothetical protein
METSEAQDTFKRIGWVVCLQLETSLGNLYKPQDDSGSSEEVKFYNEGLDAAYKLIADRRDEIMYGKA